VALLKTEEEGVVSDIKCRKTASVETRNQSSDLPICGHW
jgi:hypothetical protein